MVKKWTTEEEKYLIDHNLQQPVEKIAKTLGRTIDSVRRKKERMGLAQSKKTTTRRAWTKREEEYLLSKYINQSTERTAKQLDRSVKSVKRKASKLGLNHYLDNINAKAIARCFNCDVSVVIRWINKKGLPARKIVCHNQTRYSIDPIEFWTWAEKNKTLINWSRYEDNSLPPQPDWVQEEINNIDARNSRKRFTFHERANIEFLLKTGMTCAAVAEQTGRSLHSIRHISRNIKTER